jgi:hypothetical protein
VRSDSIQMHPDSPCSALTAESEQANTRDGYILANTLAFERSMTPTIEIAEAWKQSCEC